MPRVTRLNVLYFAVVVLVGACTAVGATVLAQSQEPRAPVSNAFTFQGRAEVDGVPVDGVCDLRFRLFNAAVAGTQTGPTVDRLAVPVAGGLFSVALDFGAGVFTGEARFLAVELRCPAGTGSYIALPGRQELTATPYALYAQQVPYTGIIGGPPGFGEGWENVLIVAKSGGQFTSIQAAIDSISGASETNRFLVWVAPGIYEERISIPSFVTVRGADRDLVTIEVVGGGSLANSTAVTMSDHSALESIRVEITGAAVETRAIQAQGSSATSSEIKISDVSAWCGATGDCSGLYVANTTLEADDVEIEVFVSSPGVSTGDAFGIRATASNLRVQDFSIEASRGSANEETYGVDARDGTSYQLEHGTIVVSSNFNAYGITHLSGGEGVVTNSTVDVDSSATANGVTVLGTGRLSVRYSQITTHGQVSSTGIGISGGHLKLVDVDVFSTTGPGAQRTGIFLSAPLTPEFDPIELIRVRILSNAGAGMRAIYVASTAGEVRVVVRESELEGFPFAVVTTGEDQFFSIFNSELAFAGGPGFHFCYQSYIRALELDFDCK